MNAGHSVVIFDNFSNSHPEVIDRIKQITGKMPRVVRGDIRDQSALQSTLQNYECTSVIHFAGLKSVGESVNSPLDYYDNNVIGTHRLLMAMQATGIKTLVFSSSATVYGNPQYFPITESHPLSVINPYGRTKLIVEELLRDHFRAISDWRIGILRYFNPVGAHESGLIGEYPVGTPNNLMPLIGQVAIGERERLYIWGGDYPTSDGTGVRDYIHVVDLAAGHLKALERLTETQCFSVNLGAGRGYSVLEVIKAFENVSSQTIPYMLAPRRVGDVAVCYADTTLALQLLGWSAERDIKTMCADHWRWVRNTLYAL
jgi:UDP-glucose 4-epimerase